MDSFLEELKRLLDSLIRLKAQTRLTFFLLPAEVKRTVKSASSIVVVVVSFGSACICQVCF